MLHNSIHSLIQRYGIISDQVEVNELTTLLTELQQTLQTIPDGVIVEFGCFAGTTSLYVRRLLNELENESEFHVYDSFTGLPDKTAQDLSPAGEQFKAGELSASKKEFITNFKKANLKLPIIHKGWFSDFKADDVPERISFAFLDGDYYQSIKDSLELVWPKLQPGATVIVDDYMNEALPGAQKAVDEWLKQHPAKLVTIHSLAIIHT